VFTVQENNNLDVEQKSRNILTGYSKSIPFFVPWEKLKSRVDNVLGHGGFSILDILKVKSGENEMDVTFRKCSCSSVWCPECYKKLYVPELQAKIGNFDWSKTRHVVLTIDREKFKSGFDAIQYVHKKKSIPAFIRNLQRGKKPFKKISISRWLWALEWHEDGYPHWHFLIEVSEAGSMGQIGGDMLRHYWGLSTWVYETYFHNAKHFEAVAGYYGKQGYFEKGYKCQGKLPDEIRENVRRRIRRNSYVDVEERRIKRAMKMMKKKADVDSMVKVVCKDVNLFMEEVERRFRSEAEKIEKKEKNRFSYSMVLGRCGEKTIVLINFNSVELMGVVNISYKEMKGYFPGEYKEKVGQVVKLDFFDGLQIVKEFERLIAYRFVEKSYGDSMVLFNKTYRWINEEMMKLEREA
jgi:hypothetical protein